MIKRTMEPAGTNGNTIGDTWFADRSNPAADCGRHRTVAIHRAQVPLPTQGQALAAAQSEGVARDGPVPGEEQSSRLAAIGQSGPRQVEAPSQDQLTPWADQIYQWIAKDRLQLTRIHELLIAGGCELSYQSLRRFVLKRNWRRVSKTTVRMSDTRPGEVAEADFGRLEMITDPITGRRQVVWGMVIVLCHSHH